VGGGLVGGLCSLFVLQGGAEVIHVPFHVVPLGLAERLCGLDKALSARRPPFIGVKTVG